MHRGESQIFLLAGEELGHPRLNHINYLDKSRSSPLHLAVRGGNIDAIYFCMANGAKIDQQQVECSVLCAGSSESELVGVGKDMCSNIEASWPRYCRHK